MKLLMRLLKHARPYWSLMILGGVCILLMTGLNLVTPWMVRDLIALLNEDFGPQTLPQIRNIALILACVYLARIGVRFGSNYFPHKAAWQLVADMREKVYDHLQKLSLRYYQDKQTGQLMSRTINDTATFETLIAHAVPDLITNLLVLAGVTALMLIMNPTLTLLTCIPIPFIFIASFFFAKKILPNFRKAQSDLAEMNASLQDNLSGIKEIQVFNQQDTERRHIKKRAVTYTESILRALRKSAVFHPSVEFVTSLGTVIVVGFGGLMAVNQGLPVADIVGFILYLSLFYAPISTLARVTEDLQQALAGAERVFVVLDEEPDIQDKPGARDLGQCRGRIQFDDVSFRYTADRPILKNVSLTIEPGQMLALVGPTGVGKSTMISLLARFYDPVEGRILIDGNDIREATLHSLRDQISIVLQDIFLFNGTVTDNIAYANPSATHEDIVRAATAACIHDDILELEQGYDTVIGERGVKLSGGQKQRLSIARAILRNTPILILDEATASVDVETEAKIQQAINNLAGSRTILVIAHRLSTVRRADRILVLHEGEIVESGTHDGLLEQDGIYARLSRVQAEATRLVNGQER